MSKISTLCAGSLAIAVSLGFQSIASATSINGEETPLTPQLFNRDLSRFDLERFCLVEPNLLLQAARERGTFLSTPFSSSGLKASSVAYGGQFRQSFMEKYCEPLGFDFDNPEFESADSIDIFEVSDSGVPKTPEPSSLLALGALFSLLGASKIIRNQEKI